MTSDLAVVESAALAPMPMGDNFRRYRVLQNDIDKAMPDCIIKIQGREFRKKNYWRAVGVAFSLKVECLSESRIVLGEDWGYQALYRATAKNGMSADGDGICMASEKAERQRSEHNVRSHGHTRAYNRAISNLVGFGEVSAEEVEREGHVTVEVEKTAYVPTIAEAHVGTVAPTSTVPFDVPDNTPILEAQPPPGFVLVTDVTKREGSSPRGPWCLYIVKFSDGAEGSTFDASLAESALAAQASKRPIIPTLQPSGKGTGKMNLIALVRA